MLNERDAKRFLREYRIWIVLASSLAAFLWLALSSESFQECVKANNSQDGEQSFYESAAYLIWASKFCGGVFLEGNNGGITALATVLLVVLNAALWVVTGKSAEIAERALNELEAPFLFPKTNSDDILGNFRRFELYDKTDFANSSVKPKVSFVIANYGRTPAIIRYVSVAFDHSSAITPNPLLDVLGLPGEEIVLDKETISQFEYTAESTSAIGRAEYKTIKSATSFLILSGQIEYSDTMGGDWVQHFCLQYYFEGKRFISSGGSYNRRERKQSQN